MITAVELELQAVQQQRYREARQHQRIRCVERTLAFLRKRETEARPLPSQESGGPVVRRTFWV